MTDDPTTALPAADTSATPEPVLEPSKVTPARITASGASPRRRTKSVPEDAATGTDPSAVLATTDPDESPPLRAEHVEITQGGVGDVEATTVSITQGGARDIEATTVSITQGGIRDARADAVEVQQGGIVHADAKDIAVSSGAIVFATGERVSVEMGAIGVIHDAAEARLTQSAVGLTIGQDVTIDQSLVNTLIADRVTIRQPSAVLVLIARQVDGTVRPLLDWRGAIVAGVVAGVVMGLLRRGRL